MFWGTKQSSQPIHSEEDTKTYLEFDMADVNLSRWSFGRTVRLEVPRHNIFETTFPTNIHKS